MKKTFILTLIFSVGLAFGYAQTTAPSTPAADAPTEIPEADKPAFEWVEETHDFGKIPQGTPVTNRFVFTNSGKTDLVVSNVKKSCGCTVTDWTKKEVPTRESGFVEATFNAARVGRFTKTITVNSNSTTPVKILYFKGEVVEKENLNLNDENMMKAPAK